MLRLVTRRRRGVPRRLGYKEDGSGLKGVGKRKRACAREAQRRCRCSIACESALAGSILVPSAEVHRSHLALEAEACKFQAAGVQSEGACAESAADLRTAHHPGLKVEEKRCFVGVAGPGTVASGLSDDQQ